MAGAGFYLRGACHGRPARARASTSAATAASTSAAARQAREREAQHGRPVVDADRLQRRAGPGGARRAGRAGGREHAARLERVQQRLGRQAREGERGDVRRARRARHRRAHAGHDGGQRAERRLLEAIAQGGDAFLGAVLDGGARQRARPRRSRPAPAGSRCRRAGPRSWPPPTHSGASRAPGAQPQRARAARSVQLVRGERDAVGAQRARRAGAPGRTPARRRRADGGRLRSPAAPAGGRRPRSGWRVPSSLFTSISATTAVSGRTAAAIASALTTPLRSGATTSSA